ncbi:MAG: 50S ribosomal protein L25 [Planctomycetaceae bacterium]|nr:50S ribosomal protein L25 [Planctomycetaceae bacterium]
MSNDPKLVAEPRDSAGTSSSKRLRSSGRTPGVLYGHKLETISFSVTNDVLIPILKTGHKVVDLELNGQEEKAIIQEVQWDTFSTYVQHFDLLRVSEDERIHANVSITLKGTAPGTLSGGILNQPHHTIPVECPVIRLPDKIELRIGSLEMGQSIHVSDLELPPEVTTTLSPSEVLVQVVAPKVSNDETEETEEETPAAE